MKQGTKHSFARLLRTALVAGCAVLGGCSDSSNPAQLAGIEGTGSPHSTGTIDRFGSIYVNGVHFNTDAARVMIDGEAAEPERLAQGMVVTVQGPINPDLVSGTAQTVTVEHTLQGAVSEVTDLGSGRRMLVVLGQAVLVVADTFVDDMDPEALEAGLYVLITGYRDNEGTVVATRLAAAPDQGVRLVDELTGLDLNNSRFSLGGLTVDFSQTQITGGLSSDLRNGQRVAVKGELAGELLLAAEQVRLLKSPTPVASTGRVSLQGIVTQWQSDTQFTLGQQRVDARGAEFTAGGQNSLMVGDRVAAVGEINAEGILEARRVHVFLPTVIQLEGPVEAVDTVADTLTVLGTEFRVTDFTGYHDHSRAKDRFLSLEHLALGDRVEVLAREEFGRLTAVQLRRKDAPMSDPMKIVLRGRVSRIESPTLFFVADVAIDASELDDPKALDLLGRLEAGQEVRVEGSQIDTNSIQATRLDIKELPPCPPDQSPPGCTSTPRLQKVGP